LGASLRACLELFKRRYTGYERAQNVGLMYYTLGWERLSRSRMATFDQGSKDFSGANRLHGCPPDDKAL